jgi:hypothetical protein
MAIVFAIVTLVASIADADTFSKEEAGVLGYHIVYDAVCGTRYAVLAVATLRNKGAKAKEFEVLKTEILQGKESARLVLTKEGKQKFCGKSRDNLATVRDHASDAMVLGAAAAKDRFCGTHGYQPMLNGMKKRGELYPGMLNDYAEEFAKGKRLEARQFAREGEITFCRVDRNRERENVDFESIVRALGLYEPPSFND